MDVAGTREVAHGARGKIKTILYPLPLTVKSGLGGSWRGFGIQSGVSLCSILGQQPLVIVTAWLVSGGCVFSRGLIVPVSRETNPHARLTVCI